MYRKFNDANLVSLYFLTRAVWTGINLIFAIIDIFKGFKAGEEEYGGILGGIVGSVEGLLKGFIGMPLDLLKKGISFILEKMGFTQVSEALDKFSFTELIGNLVGGIVDFFKNFVSNVKKIINAILSKSAQSDL